ncbi:YiiX/YebB-like N1pC/P60 family cysteine hydrolase [Flavobacterium sp.]|uniref:YiiX/YebB-like N1pC/P60 family cysteine hydrolase n=1 Tax=Flavobacterium sp. TaxID=239 RepID=UPI0026196390|nr:YiiX/YebB-like N1pC/P60 family cysteine hydrolase [Flavobacterium sp.]MDD2985441.1 YiiX/YebB-like N1pC/P60 family cysteine hydrolase [Flavobacterium sp.]
MKRFLFLILLFQFSCFVQAQKIQLQTGDLLFQKMNCGELCEAIHAVTKGYQGNDFSHLGLVLIENDSVFILEAAGNAVRKVTLEEFSKNTTTTMFIGRVKKKYEKLIPQVISFSKEQLGIPYDDDYLYDNGKYYCSELIYDAFLNAYGKPFFELQPMTFKQPETNVFFPAWVAYYNDLKIEIPEGKPGCNPGGISTSKKIKIIGKLN